MESLESLHGRTPLLFIEPCQPPSSTPVIDSLTRKMTAALRKAETSNYAYCGVHQCVCSVLSTNCDYFLPDGAVTNSLCVHYLAHHRQEVPPAELEKVSSLDYGECEPHPSELQGEEYRRAAAERYWGVSLGSRRDETTLALEQLGIGTLTSAYLNAHFLPESGHYFGFFRVLRNMPAPVLLKFIDLVRYRHGDAAKWSSEILLSRDLKRFGVSIFCLLIEACDHSDPEFRTYAFRSLRDLFDSPGLKEFLACHAPDVDMERAFAVLRGVIDRYPHEQDWCDAIAILMELGPRARGAARSALPAILRALADPWTRSAAITALGALGPDADPAVPALIDLALYGRRGIGQESRDALAKIGNWCERALPRLIAMLNADDQFACRRAANILRSAGQQARPAVDALIRAFRQAKEDYVRREIRRALEAIDPDRARGLFRG